MDWLADVQRVLPHQLSPFPTRYSATVYLLSVAFLCGLYYGCVAYFGLGPHEEERPVVELEKAPSTTSDELLSPLRTPTLSARSTPLPSIPSLIPTPLSTLPTRRSNLSKVKIRGWIVTGFSSGVMTVASTPFMYDLFKYAGDVAKIGRREALAEGLTSFFMAYLICDCALGWFHYRSQFNILTGWVHHTAYTALLSYIISQRFTHVFALAAFMELPTFVLSLAMVFPATRSDTTFSILFFATRIVYHAYLITIYATPYGRLHGTQLYSTTSSPLYSIVPLFGLCAAAPLHILWFQSSIRGQLKRHRRAQLARIPTPPSPFLLPARRLLPTLSLPTLPPSFLSLSASISRQRPSFRRPYLVARNGLKGNTYGRTTYDYLIVSAESFRVELEGLGKRALAAREAAGVEVDAIGKRAAERVDAGVRAVSREGREEMRKRGAEEWGRRGEEVRRFGGRMRRRVGGFVGGEEVH